MKAYVLVEVAPGKVKGILKQLKGKQMAGCQVTNVDVVTGPYDLIATVEGPDLDAIGTCVTAGIGAAEGIQRTLTCVVVSLG